MATNKRQDYLEFAIVLDRELTCEAYRRENRVALPASEYTVSQLADKLIRAARRLHRIAEDCCNYGREEDDARFERTCNRVIKLLEPYGIRPIFSGDPRGACLKLELPHTKRINGWGGEGWCVPR